jgi:hypothetical protein
MANAEINRSSFFADIVEIGRQQHSLSDELAKLLKEQAAISSPEVLRQEMAYAYQIARIAEQIAIDLATLHRQAPREDPNILSRVRVNEGTKARLIAAQFDFILKHPRYNVRFTLVNRIISVSRVSPDEDAKIRANILLIPPDLF